MTALKAGGCVELAVVVVDAAGALLLLGELRVEVAVQRRYPRESPVHAALVGLQRGNRRARPQ